jgi:hypothetical protein
MQAWGLATLRLDLCDSRIHLRLHGGEQLVTEPLYLRKHRYLFISLLQLILCTHTLFWSVSNTDSALACLVHHACADARSGPLHPQGACKLQGLLLY